MREAEKIGHVPRWMPPWPLPWYESAASDAAQGERRGFSRQILRFLQQQEKDIFHAGPGPQGANINKEELTPLMIKFLERLGLRPKAKNAINPGYVLTDDPHFGPGAHSFDLFKQGKSAQERKIAYERNDAVEEMRRDLNVGPESNPFPVRGITDPNILALDDISLLEYTRKK